MRYFVCSEDDCAKVVKSAAGLTRHMTMMHLRNPTVEEQQPLELNNDGSPLTKDISSREEL